MNILLKKVPGNSVQMAGESFLGSDCTGNDGDLNRVLTTANIDSRLGDLIVASDGNLLKEGDNYTISGNDITFLIKVWDERKIELRYIK